MDEKSYPLVIPVILQDLPTVLNNIQYYLAYLPINKVFFIGPEEIKPHLPTKRKYFFINENDIVDISKLNKTFYDLCDERTKMSRIGWYIQQFIKMAFSMYCEDEYYLLWDSDTIPTKRVEMFSPEGKPFFDCKSEFHKPYFDTIKRLLPSIGKEIKESFISEHMLVKTHLMKELIHEIELNQYIRGDNFMEKILYAISPMVIGQSGFSEFETYGSYVVKSYPEFYEIRKWNSLRWGSFFFENKKMLDWQLDWLSKYYNAVSFEKNQDVTLIGKILKPKLLPFINPRILDIVSLLPRSLNYIGRLIRQR